MEDPAGTWQALVDNLLRVEYDRVPHPKAPFADIENGLHETWLQLGPLKAAPPPNPSNVVATFSREQLEAMRSDFEQMFAPVLSRMLQERALLFRYLAISVIWTSHYRLVKRR